MLIHPRRFYFKFVPKLRAVATNGNDRVRFARASRDFAPSPAASRTRKSNTPIGKGRLTQEAVESRSYQDRATLVCNKAKKQHTEEQTCHICEDVLDHTSFVQPCWCFQPKVENKSPAICKLNFQWLVNNILGENKFWRKCSVISQTLSIYSN